MRPELRQLSFMFLFACLSTHAFAQKEGDPAPLFELKNQDGQSLMLKNRENQGWTVLFFYPKAGTPGCTKQVCAFRDAINMITKLNTAVYGISADTVSDQKKFHTEHKLKFDLLADPDAKVIAAYGVKIPVIGIAKRHTFILDPKLIIRKHFDDVDPATDPEKVRAALVELQKNNKN